MSFVKKLFLLSLLLGMLFSMRVMGVLQGIRRNALRLLRPTS